MRLFSTIGGKQPLFFTGLEAFGVFVEFSMNLNKGALRKMVRILELHFKEIDIFI